MKLDFKEDVKINPARLDIECLRQAELMSRYGAVLTDAKDNLRRAHQHLKLTRSKLVLMAKKGQAETGCGTKKPSDSVCEAFYRTHPEHESAVEKHIEAQKEEEDIQQAVYSIVARKTSLELLIKLLSMEYFASPSEPYDITNSEFDKVSKIVKQQSKEHTTERMARKRVKRQ